ncbi:MAG: RNA 2',3'-cyclic phosphodiesterase [Actinomycetota bacterium]
MSRVERLRLFVAVDVPAEHRIAVARDIEPLRRALPEARWTALESQHITLKFLGWTPSDRLEVIERAVQRASAAHERAEVSLSGIGAFPSERRARVLWVGLDDRRGLLARIASDLERALEPLGYAREKPRFTPHLTLARLKTPARLDDSATEVSWGDAGPFLVSSVVLYRSRLSASGARYEALRAFALR